jgi:hypothetical protein
MDFATDSFQEGYEALLAAAAAGAADLGEVLATAARIQDGDADSWLREWTATGGAAWAAADRRPSARRYLHAATYYAAPLALIADTDGSVSEAMLWRRQRTCWERAVELLRGERLAIPYGDHALPGYFFTGGRGRRPLVVIDHGGREATSQAWAQAGNAAHARGYHWMTFDGPGRQAALVEQGLVLRPDWEAVLTSVVDTLLARPLVDPGVFDVSTQWTDALPSEARAALLAGDRAGFDREIHLAGLFDPRANAVLRRRGRWYGFDGRSPFDVYARVREFRLGDETERITTPVFVRFDAHERRWPGQARVLYERLPGSHHTLSTGDAFDWLDRALATDGRI